MHRANRVLVPLLAAVLSACSPTSPRPSSVAVAPATTQAPDLAAYESAWKEVGRLEKSNQRNEALAAIVRQIQRDDFGALPEDVGYQWLHEAGVLEIELEAYEQAHLVFERTSQMSMATEDDWRYRFISAQISGARADAILALTTLARRWPEQLKSFNSRFVHRAVMAERADRASDDARFFLLEALYAAQWKLEYDIEPSAAWADFVRLLLDRGDLGRAASVSASITSPRILLALRVDKRFDAIVRAAPARFDIAAAMAREIGAFQSLAAAWPRQLDLKYELICAYLDAAQNERALAVADAVLSDASRETAYDDYADKINWILDSRAMALRRVGRWREALSYLEQAAAHLENGRPNVSNAINLAGLHAQFGRSREALAALGTMAFETEGVSEYGGMQIHHVLLLAAIAGHDTTSMKDALEFMREHQSAASSTYQEALLDANEIEQAADLLIRRLKDPVLRGAALEEMQDYRSGALSPSERTFEARWRQLKARSDVQATLAEFGRIETVALAPPLY